MTDLDSQPHGCIWPVTSVDSSHLSVSSYTVEDLAITAVHS